MEKAINQFHKEIKRNLGEIRTKIENMHFSKEPILISYFTYSFSLSHEANTENLCLGSYHIRNLSSKTITNLCICIKIPKDSPFSFTGKYIYKDMLPKVKNPDSWERMNERENHEEYWLKPLGHQSIRPNEMISFSNFQIKWAPTKSYAGSIMGFTYSEENKEGIAAINAINLSGTVYSGEGNDE